VNECTHTQSTASKLSSFLKSWTSLPVGEVREYGKAIKSATNQLASTQRALETRISALDNLSGIFEEHHTIKDGIKR